MAKIGYARASNEDPLAPDPGYCIGCGRPSESWACADCRASLDHVVTMLHAPRGELVATWLSIMTTDARLERDRDAPAAETSLPARQNGGVSSRPPGGANDRLLALGLVTEQSAMMEQQIQDAFCALAGSEFAVALAGDQTAGWIIEKCEALADAHRELPDADRQAIKDALRACREANARRNDLIHGVQAPSRTPGGGLKMVESLTDTREPAAKPWAIASLRAAGEALLQAGLGLAGAIQQAFAPQGLPRGEALGREDAGGAPGQQCSDLIPP